VDVFERLQEAAHELGALPSDVLLARRFVVLEGDSDVQALSTWAQTLGCPLQDRGVQLVPAHGHGSAALVSRFLDLAYEGSSMVVILDNGRDTDKTKLEIEARFGDRVRIRLLAQTEIERYYSARAIIDWLRLLSAAIEASEERSIADRIALDPSKRLLRTLAREYLGRDYDVVVDGRAIVNLMPERDVPDEIKGLIYDLADD
jgi:predicted ATP-dependent endonuclease of OLD family